MVLNVQRTPIAGNRSGQLVFRAVLPQTQAADFHQHQFYVAWTVVISAKRVFFFFFLIFFKKSQLLLAAIQEKE